MTRRTEKILFGAFVALVVLVNVAFWAFVVWAVVSIVHALQH